MIRICKTIAILFVGTVAAEALFVVPTRELVAILIVLMAVTMQFGRGKENDFRVISYVAALSAIGFLYFGEPIAPTNAVAAKPVIVQAPGPSTTIDFDPRDGSATVWISGEYLRPIVEERKQLRQESPEEWRRQLRERRDKYRRAENGTD